MLLLSKECLTLLSHLCYFCNLKWFLLCSFFFAMLFMMNEKVFIVFVNVTSVFNQSVSLIIMLSFIFYLFNIVLPSSTKVDAILRSTVFFFTFIGIIIKHKKSQLYLSSSSYSGLSSLKSV